jgi:site-specific DNA-methyltransferase (adenine-specific)
MQINETTYNAMPAHLRALFVKVPNPGKDEVLAGFPVTSPSKSTPRNNGEFKSVAKGRDLPHVTHGHDDNGGSAARFFYCAKASKSDRGEGNGHPTVKPIDLMRYLCRLVTPPKGIVLDPFMGSGSTGKAAVLEGFSFVGMELDADYFKIAQARVSSSNQSDSGQCGLFDGVQP